MKGWIIPPMMVAALGLAAAGPDPAPEAKVMTKEGIRYACTGISVGARQDPRWGDFSTKLVFTADQGAYLADVAVRIEEESGGQVFQAHCDSPWLVIDLPKGKYDVFATARDSYESSVELTVDGQQQTSAILSFSQIRSNHERKKQGSG